MRDSPLADWACYLFSAYMLLLTALQLHAWSVTVSLYGRVPLVESKKTLGYKITSLAAYQLFWPLFGIAAVLLAHEVLGVVRPTSLVAALVACLIYAWVYHATPPSVLLLGTSRAATIALRHDVERGVHPYRVVALLDASPARGLPQAGHVANYLEWDNFRTFSSDWQSVVHPMMDMTPLIVLDTRVPSPAVVEESRRILGVDALKGKTVFVVADSGKAPSLAAAAADPAPAGVRVEAVMGELKRMGLARTASPDDS